MSSSFTGNPNNFLQTDYTFPPDPSQFNVQLRYYLNDIATAVNSKDSGLYDSITTVTGQQFYPTYSTQSASSSNFRSVLRLVVDTGTLPNAGTSTTAHGITFGTTLTATRIYGAATDPGNEWIPLPYASPTANKNIEIYLDSTNINIITGIDRTNFTRSFVVIEYITTV